MDHRALGDVARFRSAWKAATAPAVRRALAALFVVVTFGTMHLARIGSPVARGLAAAAIALSALAIVVSRIVAWRRGKDPRAVIRTAVASAEPELAGAILRALTLSEQAAEGRDVGSPALVALHRSKLFSRVSIDRVTDRAEAIAARWSNVGLVLAMGAVAAVAVSPLRVVEGIDVLLAQDGTAPLPIAWIDDVEIDAHPPDYLHEPFRPVLPFMRTSLPLGTMLTMRGRPLHEGRAVVLTDGETEVPFVDDGSGSWVAHFPIQGTAKLFVAARFGEVRIPQPDEQEVIAIPDDAPVVVLEGAPRTVRLLDEPSVPLRYEATDDHGLRQIDLVLRTGTREERRVLSRPNTDAKVDRGGYELRATDPFFKRTYAPVEVTIEARDADPVSGPKWGRSPSVLVVPPEVGEPEALRYAALAAGRDAMTDLLAKRLAPFEAKTAPERAQHKKTEAENQDIASQAVSAAVNGSYGGLSVPRRAAVLVLGQLRRLDSALATEGVSGTSAAHQRLVGETEAVVLALDAGLGALGARDARIVAKRLAEVADEAAAASSLAIATIERPRGQARLAAAVEVLGGGGRQLLKLGALGLDLGEIVGSDLRRIARASDAGDYVHAELAARDLAARLRKPDPSFAGGGGGGVESGGGGSGSPGDGDPSDADDEAEQIERELQALMRDHEDEIGDVAEALEKAASGDDLDALREEALERAEALREAVRSLPRSGGVPGSAEAAAAAAREQAESMAAALEGSRPSDAVESGRGALRSLDEAMRAAKNSLGQLAEERAGRASAGAKPTVEENLDWAEKALETLRRKASERARGALDMSGGDEGKLAERARELSQKGESGDAAMPQKMLDHLSEAEQAMREAVRALKAGNGDEGLRHQKDAQRLLEMAQGERGEEPEDRPESSQQDGKAPSGKADIPGKDTHHGPEEFRKRVMEGLGGSADPMMREAVKRYAEGLLR